MLWMFWVLLALVVICTALLLPVLWGIDKTHGASHRMKSQETQSTAAVRFRALLTALADLTAKRKA